MEAPRSESGKDSGISFRQEALGPTVPGLELDLDRADCLGERLNDLPRSYAVVEKRRRGRVYKLTISVKLRLKLGHLSWPTTYCR